MTKTNFNICIGGSAGQGIATIGKIMARAIVRKGYHLHCLQVYESRVRGSYNGFTLRVGTRPVFAPVDEIDILISLNRESFEVNRPNLAKDAVALSDTDVMPDQPRFFQVPFAKMGEGPWRASLWI